mmetsp:Transcript_9151/g.41628  ORF Transcript_9151/g.41628 Transcript_9151/m.41628 type:complete len:325 (-) Transcript_9151:739-1713(-)
MLLMLVVTEEVPQRAHLFVLNRPRLVILVQRLRIERQIFRAGIRQHVHPRACRGTGQRPLLKQLGDDEPGEHPERGEEEPGVDDAFARPRVFSLSVDEQVQLHERLHRGCEEIRNHEKQLTPERLPVPVRIREERGNAEHEVEADAAKPDYFDDVRVSPHLSVAAHHQRPDDANHRRERRAHAYESLADRVVRLARSRDGGGCERQERRQHRPRQHRVRPRYRQQTPQMRTLPSQHPDDVRVQPAQLLHGFLLPRAAYLLRRRRHPVRPSRHDPARRPHLLAAAPSANLRTAALYLLQERLSLRVVRIVVRKHARRGCRREVLR